MVIKRFGMEGSLASPGVSVENVQPAGHFYPVVQVMVDPIGKRLHQNLTPFDAANRVFHCDAKAGNALVVTVSIAVRDPFRGFFFGC
jgi:hypothetical protein